MSNKVNPALFRIPLFPFLIATSPTLSLFSLNSWGLNTVDLIRPILVHLIFVVVIFAVCKKILGSYRSAATLSCIPIFSVIFFGHVSNWIYSVFGTNIDDIFFLSIWLILTIGIFFSSAHTLKKSKNSFFKLTAILNTFGITLVFLSLLPLILSRLPNDIEPSVIKNQDLLTQPIQHDWLPTGFSAKQIDALPDFYFIIMDSYARGDVLESRFGLDNSQFFDWLEAKGFFIAKYSHSNYAWTHLSMGATLNAEYLQTLIPRELLVNQPESFHDQYLFTKQVIRTHFINSSRALRFFSALGYRVVSSGSGYRATRKQHRYLTEALFGPLTELEKALFSNSILRPVFSKSHTNEVIKRLQIAKYDQVVGALDSLVFDAYEPGPKFVSYHIISPHEPFSFDSNGDPVSRHPYYDSTDWIDKYSMTGFKDWYRINYRKNVEGLNHHLKSAIQDILNASGGNAVIILQSDHGSSLGLNPQSPVQSDLVERFGILNAIFLPSNYPREHMTDNMSAVNTFPIVFNNVFDLQIPTQENRAYYSNGDLEFIDVTDKVCN